MLKNKIVSADEAVAIIRDRDTICTSGFVGVGTPDELLIALEKRYRDTRHPAALTAVFAAAPGDAKDRGLNRLAHDGLLKRVIGGHWALVPKLGELALVEPYRSLQPALGMHLPSLPQHRCGRSGNHHQGRAPDVCRSAARRRQAQRRRRPRIWSNCLQINGEDWLATRRFRSMSPLLRGTTADPAGNITMEREALTLDNLAMAMAAKNSGGFVIVQVERIADEQFA